MSTAIPRAPGTAQPRAASYSRAGLALASGLFAMLVVEIALRCILPPADLHFRPRITDEVFDNRAGKALAANGVEYHFDPTGFRSTQARTPANAPRILFIGDSFTQGFGTGDEETFPARTCEQLARLGLPARCLNAGVTGFGTAHEWRLLRKLIDRRNLTIDAVVFQILPNNDLHDNWEDAGFAAENGRLVELVPPHVPPGVRWRGAFYDWTRNLHSQIVAGVANAWSSAFIEMRTSDYPASFEVEKRLLSAIVEATRARRIPILFVVCATSWELTSRSTERYDERSRLELVSAAVADLHVPWIDSRDVVLSQAGYLPGDGHFSPAGNALMGEAISKRLRDLVPRHEASGELKEAIQPGPERE